MQSGIYRGFQRRSGDTGLIVPKLLARATNSATSQTGVTGVTDITGLTIDFALDHADLFEVVVHLYVPFVYNGTSGGYTGVQICDGSNTLMAQNGVSGAANYTYGVIVEEIIRVGGSYTRKARFWQNIGGTSNTYVDSTYVQRIEAYERPILRQ